MPASKTAENNLVSLVIVLIALLASNTAYCPAAVSADNQVSSAADKVPVKTKDEKAASTSTLLEGGPSQMLTATPPLVAELNDALAVGLHGDLNNGIAMLSTLIAKAPKMALAYNDRGMLYYRASKLTEAEADLNKALDLDKTDSEYWSNRGLIYMMKGSEPEALKDLDQAISISNKNTLALATRGAIFMRHGSFDKAKADFDLALASDPNSALNLNNRAMARFQTGDSKGALDDINKALTIEPNSEVMKKNLELFKRVSPGELSIKAESELSVRNGHLRKGEEAPPAIPVDQLSPDTKK